MAKRFRESSAPSPLKGRSAGVPAGKPTHAVRVMHRECVTRTTRDRYKLRKFAYAVVEYRGTRPVRVLGASDDRKQADGIAYSMASTFDRNGDHATVRTLESCKAVTKKAQATTRQELHIADIDRVRECRACGGRAKSKLCKPRGASHIDRREAVKTRTTLVSASVRDDSPADPNIITRWTKADEKAWK